MDRQRAQEKLVVKGMVWPGCSPIHHDALQPQHQDMICAWDKISIRGDRGRSWLAGSAPALLRHSAPQRGGNGGVCSAINTAQAPDRVPVNLSGIRAPLPKWPGMLTALGLTGRQHLPHPSWGTTAWRLLLSSGITVGTS